MRSRIFDDDLNDSLEILEELMTVSKQKRAGLVPPEIAATRARELEAEAIIISNRVKERSRFAMDMREALR